MFFRIQGDIPRSHPGEIDHPDMPMGFLDEMDVHISGLEERNEPLFGLERRAVADQLHFETALFPCLPQGRLFGVLVQLDVRPDRQPLFQLLMEDEKDLLVPDDENGDGEIDLFVEMGQGTSQGLGLGYYSSKRWLN